MRRLMIDKEEAMRVTILLADAATTSEGKLYVLGGGWTHTVPMSPMSLAIKIDVPWDEGGQRHDLKIELLEMDGEPFVVADHGPLAVEAPFEVGRPQNVLPGSVLPATFAINFGPLPLVPHSRYIWRVSIDGVSEDDWSQAFYTLGNQQSQ